MQQAPTIGTTGEVLFNVRKNGSAARDEWRPGYEVLAVISADDRPYRLNVRMADRVLEGIAPECFREVPA